MTTTIAIYLLGYGLALFLFLWHIYRTFNKVTGGDLNFGLLMSLCSWLSVVAMLLIELCTLIAKVIPKGFNKRVLIKKKPKPVTSEQVRKSQEAIRKIIMRK